MSADQLRIGRLAEQADVSVQTLRYYERRGLLAPPARRPSGYRSYGVDVVSRVRFIRRAQGLGFTLQEIGDLLALWPDSSRSCRRVEQRAAATLERIVVKIQDLNEMRTALDRYVSACRQRKALGACPLLTALGGPQEEP